MQFTNTRKEALIEFLKEQPFDNLIFMWNEHVEGEEPIYLSVDEIAEVAPENDPLWLAKAVYFGEIENWCEPVQFNAYGHLENIYKQDLDFEILAENLLNRYQFEWVANIGGIELSTFVDNEDLALLNLVTEFTIAKDLAHEEAMTQMDTLKTDLEENATFSWRVIE